MAGELEAVAVPKGERCGIAGPSPLRRVGGDALLDGDGVPGLVMSKVGGLLQTGPPALGGVLRTQSGREAADLAGSERRNGPPDQDPAGPKAEQVLTGQLGQVAGTADAAVLGGRLNEPEQIGHRSRSDGGHPEAEDIGMVRWVADRSQRILQQPRCDPGANGCGRPQDARSVRGWRGVHLDGRTSISMDAPGRWGNLHTKLISNKASYMQLV